MTSSARVRAAHAFLGLSLIAGALGVIAVATGGFRFYLLGIGLSARGPQRAFIIAATLAAIGLTLHASARERLHRLPPWTFTAMASMASLAVVTLGVLYGTKAAAGADAYGYISQAYLWLTGNLRVDQPLVGQVPWPAADWTFTPLGYRPTTNGTLVPTYAPGIPLLMAALVRVFGAGAEYWLHPLCGGLLVVLTYLVGRRLSGQAAGLVAAIWTAVSPLVLFLTLGLLGDLPAAAFWMTAVYLALQPGRGHSLAGGLAAACAIVIRPNLVPLAIVPALLIWFGSESRRASLVRVAIFSAGVSPAILFIAWLFNDLYGSPFVSGYGDNSQLFSLQHVWTNFQQFFLWTLASHGPFPFVFVLAVLGAAVVRERLIRAILAGFIALVFVCYAAYLPFADWWFLRFLLPALPIAFVLSTDAVWHMSRHLSGDRRFALRSAFVICAIGYSLYQTGERRVLESGQSASRFEEVGVYIRNNVPENAVVYSMEHSGSIRFYSGRMTLRYDILDPAWLDRSIEHLESLGYRAYLAIEETEVARFRERFNGQHSVAVVDEGTSIGTRPKVIIAAFTRR